ncbi:MAG: carboxypeptidase regulatory-like domain-containing protein, partial [Terriglobia bacterium]
MRAKVLFGSLVAMAFLCVWVPQPVLADITASVWGTVHDPSGAVVAGASVILRNPGTGLRRQVTTDATGGYEFLALPVGRGYVLEAEAPGFRKYVQSDLHLVVNQRFRVDVDLVVGAEMQQITVTAAPAQVESSSTQLGDVIEDRKMTGLPLNGRSFLDLMGLQAGVVPFSSSVAVTNRPISGELGAGQLSVNGNRETANAFLVNGGDVEESKNNGATVAPTLDSIQEFRVLTNSFDAEYGRFAGGIVNVVTKTGTNQLHGTGFEFLRNDKLDSRNFFDRDKTDVVTGQEIPGSARGVFKRNQFGGVLGGPILKDRLFFFGDYQGTRERRGLSTGIISVPSTGEMTGNFSDTAVTGYPALTGTVRGDTIPGDHSFDETLSTRLGYTVNSGEPYWVAGCNTTADAQAGTCVFPGQMIPQSAWSPVPKATLKFIPNPTGSLAGAPYFSTSSAKESLRDDKFGARITLNNKRAGDWSFYYHYDNSLLDDPYPQANVPGFPGITPTRAQQLNISNTRTLSPTAVNELRLNYTRLYIWQDQPSGEGLGKLSSFGFGQDALGLISTVPAVEGLPILAISGAYGFTFGLAENNINQRNNTYQVADNYSKIAGRHSLKFGVDARSIQVNEYNISSPDGHFAFYGNETGNSFADFLLGAPDDIHQQSYSTMFTRSKYFGAYAQDSYRLTHNFTINAGVRWDITEPFYETQNRLNVIDWGLNSKVYPGSPTGWVYPGDPGIPSTIAPTRYGNVAPRLGIAYSPDFKDGVLGKLFGGPGKTSIRAAFGMYYTAMEDMPAFYTIGDAPFGLYYVVPTQTYLEEPYKDRRRGNDPGQHFPWSPAPPGSKIDWSTFLPIAGSPGVALDQVVPRVMHWNFTVQRELARSTILTMGYIGTRGRHLLAAQSSNPGSAARCLQIVQILTAQGRAGEACGPNGEDQVYDLNGDGQYTLGTDAFGTRPYSITSGQFASRGLLDFMDNGYNATIGNSNYDAMEVSVEKKVGPLQLLTAYTWSKAMDNSSNWVDSNINPFNNRLSKALSAFDMTHNFVMSYGYSLPLQRLTTRAVMGKFLEGWRVAGITRFTTGLPVTLSASGDHSLVGTSGVDVPNYDGSPIQFLNPRDTSAHSYFKTQPFSPEA